ncbi:MAG TPA: imidazolonepropionase [Mycobacteriales bacterium]|nr:imidazolonepropionase [Mycobacteriales bacterium]
MTWDLLVTGARMVPMTGDPSLLVEDACVAVRGDRIAFAGPSAELGDRDAEQVLAADGRLLTPGLIDCHTHLVFAGDRSAEHAARRAGMTYAEITASGGGIATTVAATRAASDDELLALAQSRVALLARGGVTTVEVKSGYGLTVRDELRLLQVARALPDRLPADVVTTFLGAHVLPAEWRGDPDGYVALVVDEMLPAAAAAGLADAVDVFCDAVAFDRVRTAKILDAARALGLPVRLHADQTADTGGAALAAEHSALSADHLDHTGPDGVAALARSGTTAVLLPGVTVWMGEDVRPPVAQLRERGVPMAVATDANPGTSPLLSLPLAMTLATCTFGLTPDEALAGATRNAARALGLDGEVGALAPGMRADLVLWDVTSVAQLCGWFGPEPVSAVVHRGGLRS